MKKVWETPKLIVLVRGRREELVLSGCKMIYVALALVAAFGPGDAAPGCYEDVCQNCSTSSDT
jgi:hypothetical protein